VLVQLAVASAQSGFLRLVLGEVELDLTKPAITLAGRNFAPFGTHGAKLCRYGPTEIPRTEIYIPENNTDPLNLLENVVPATFVSAQRVRCQTPYRTPGTTLQVYVSMSGLRNFSATAASLTYYDGTAMVPGGGATQVSHITPSYGPISSTSIVLATGTNFAPTGWSADAIGTSPLFTCTLNALNPIGWTTQWFLPPATYVDFTHAVCNVSANLFTGVGDVTLGVTLRADVGLSRYQPGPVFTMYDPSRPPTVVDEQRAGYQPGFLDVAYGIVDVPTNVTVTGENFAPTPRLGCSFFESSDAAVRLTLTLA
jgi:hypothetical protein